MDRVAKDPIANEGDGEVAEGHHKVRHNHAFPHGLRGGPLWGRRDRGLNLQHHIVSGKRERHISQRREEVEDGACGGRGSVAVAHVRERPLVRRSHPSNGRVTACTN